MQHLREGSIVDLYGSNVLTNCVVTNVTEMYIEVEFTQGAVTSKRIIPWVGVSYLEVKQD